MATLAIACAKAEGLDVVTDRHAEVLHRCLIEHEGNSIFESLVTPADDDMPEPQKPAAREIFEYIVSFACDLSSVHAENLAAMGKDREPIRTLMAQLGEHPEEIMAPIEARPSAQEAHQGRGEHHHGCLRAAGPGEHQPLFGSTFSGSD